MSPSPHTSDVHAASPDPGAAGRDAQGRFIQGNAGGPGNPFFRRQAELRRGALALFSPEDVGSLLRVMLALGRNGDAACARVFLDYTMGKPHKAVQPDEEHLHEWGLLQRSPRLPEVLEVTTNGVPAQTAVDTVQAVMPIVAGCNLQRVSGCLRSGTDPEGNPVAPPLPPEPAAPEGGGQPSRDARRMAAGVRPAVQTGDNGEAGWGAAPDEGLAGADQTGVIGATERLRRFLGGAGGPERPGDPGPR